MSSGTPSRQPRPPPSTASPSMQRESSSGHAPLVPSSLRHSHEPGDSPESTSSGQRRDDAAHTSSQRGDGAATTGDHHGIGTANGSAAVHHDVNGILPTAAHPTDIQHDSEENPVYGTLEEPEDYDTPASEALMASYNRYRACGCEPDGCEHGTWSPRAATIDSSIGDTASTSSKTRIGSLGNEVRERLKTTRNGLFGSDSPMGALFGRGGADGDIYGRRRQRHTTRYLADRHGVRRGARLYLPYYFPFLNWIQQYRWSYFRGDLVAALTMASFYIPMALSYSENLGHLPPINGLYSFVFNPLIYAFLGTVPQMVVGPEAAGSLLVGTVVKSSVDSGQSGEDEGMMHARIGGVVTGMAGTIIFIAGLTRLGFLESVLSKPFLRGFISAIGIVILADQLIPETGLVALAQEAGVDHGSSWEKLVFLAQNMGQAHGPTCAVSFISFGIIMFCRQTKLYMQPKHPSVAYIPDRFIVVVMSAICAYAWRWDKLGIEVLGDVQSSTGAPFPVHFPFVPSYMHHVREAMGTSFLIALLGFFESSVAAKSLSSGEPKDGEGITGVQHSANRELVALGVANMVGGCFMALPAFGGYGRSKVNASTGGKTPMSSILLSFFTFICVLFVLPYFYYLPKGVLCAMVSVVAYSLIEECPHDISFFLRIRGWQELILMFIIFFATIFYSLPLGIALGMGLSLLAVIRHATQPRIQILGRRPGSGAAAFENAELMPHDIEFVKGCLIVKIPEPLTFANTGDLRNRLRRLEHYGTGLVHPALPRVRHPEHNQNIIFDVHGVTSLDGSGAQVLAEIVAMYVENGTRVFFCRVQNPRHPVFRLFIRSGIVEKVGGMRHFVMSLEEALTLAMEPEEVSAFQDQADPPV